MAPEGRAEGDLPEEEEIGLEDDAAWEEAMAGVTPLDDKPERRPDVQAAEVTKREGAKGAGTKTDDKARRAKCKDTNKKKFKKWFIIKLVIL